MEDIKNETLSINEELAKSEYPYDKCIFCSMRNAKHCDGPNPYALKGARRIDFLKKLQRANKETFRDNASWSYDYIASKTDGVSKATVVRIMTDENYDPGTYAYGEVFRVLFDSSSGVYPCGIHSEEKEIVYVDSPETLKEMERLQQENISIQATLEQLRGNIGKTHDFQKEELAIVRGEQQRKIDHLLGEIRDLLKEQTRLHEVISNQQRTIDKLMEK